MRTARLSHGPQELRNFVKIVDLGSRSRAASVLNIAQPALSLQVLGLEREQGRQLLTRAARGVSAMASGMALYGRAVRWLRGADDIQAAVRSVNNMPSGRVVIGIPVSVACFIAVPLVRAVVSSLPHVTWHSTNCPAVSCRSCS